MDANSILTRYYVEKPPVPVEAIVEDMGVYVSLMPEGAPFVSVSALPPLRAGRRYSGFIEIPLKNGQPERREAIAQGLGHLLYHWRPGQVISSSTRTVRQAERARWFGDELLVPLWSLYRAAKELRRGTTVADLARWYNVPELVILRRLEHL